MKRSLRPWGCPSYGCWCCVGREAQGLAWVDPSWQATGASGPGKQIGYLSNYVLVPFDGGRTVKKSVVKKLSRQSFNLWICVHQKWRQCLCLKYLLIDFRNIIPWKEEVGSLEQVWHLAGSSRPPQQLGAWVGGRCSHQKADPVLCRAPSGPEKKKPNSYSHRSREEVMWPALTWLLLPIFSKNTKDISNLSNMHCSAHLGTFVTASSLRKEITFRASSN